MNRIDSKKVKALIHKLGLKYKMRDEDIKHLVESPYEFSALQIKKIDLEDKTTVEEVDDLKTNFNYLGFGKLYFSRLLVNKKFKQSNNIKKINSKRNGRIK